MDERIKKEDCGHYVEIYDTEYKILEKANGMLWNATEENPIAVDKHRFENGDYVESEEPIEIEVDDKEVEEDATETIE